MCNVVLAVERHGGPGVGDVASGTLVVPWFRGGVVWDKWAGTPDLLGLARELHTGHIAAYAQFRISSRVGSGLRTYCMHVA